MRKSLHKSIYIIWVNLLDRILIAFPKITMAARDKSINDLNGITVSLLKTSRHKIF